MCRGNPAGAAGPGLAGPSRPPAAPLPRTSPGEEGRERPAGYPGSSPRHPCRHTHTPPSASFQDGSVCLGLNGGFARGPALPAAETGRLFPPADNRGSWLKPLEEYENIPFSPERKLTNA